MSGNPVLDALKAIVAHWRENDPEAFASELATDAIAAIREIEGCPHGKGTVTNVHTYPATREEPSETVGTVTCNECGTCWQLDDAPEDMTLVDESGRDF